MKKLTKYVIAVTLCLIMAATMFPGAVFEADGFVPGEVNVTLYNQYYTVDDEVYGDLADILPEIEIEEYSDIYLSVLLTSPLPREKWKPSIVAKVGTTFNIKLTEKTAEAVEVAIAALKANPYVKYAEANAYAEPDIIEPIDGGEFEITVSTALAVLRVSVGLVEADPEFVSEFDMDNDGVITVADALAVLRIAAGLA